MAQKRKKPNQADQSARFIETAKKLEADESGEAFERAFKAVTKKPAPKEQKRVRG